jgi:signal transduction histidine kinase
LISTSDRLYQWSGSKFNWHNIPYVVLSARDITSILTLEHFKAENKYKTAMLRVVSHELRTTSIAMMSFTEQAMEEEDSLSSKTKCKLHMVKVCSKMMLNLIHSLVDYSQIVTGTFSLSKKMFSISEILHECYLMIKTQCEKKKIGLKLMIDPRLPVNAFNDSNRISQVLTNLLMNAIK